MGLQVRDSPYLIVIVDTEEEFDWSVFSSQAGSVTNIRHQIRMHRVFERYKLVPTYLVDFPVASKEEGYKPLRALQQDGRCEIGAQLHPWVNPPFIETVSEHNSFASNLSAKLEREKLERLTDEIERRFDRRPMAYRAGRYGFGADTAAILIALGYKVDMSVLPRTDLRPQGGPDFSAYGPEPVWLGPEKELLELPQTLEIFGMLNGLGPQIYRRANSNMLRKFRVPGMLARTGLLNRISLTPEGVRLSEAKRLTRALFGRGHRVFVLSYHSSSMQPGGTPYVCNDRDLLEFIAWVDEFLDFFSGEMAGQFLTVTEAYQKLNSDISTENVAG